MPENAFIFNVMNDMTLKNLKYTEQISLFPVNF